ncbi:cytochrome b5-like heme/steroid binding domain-containing protein [Metabacillus halosaccharovorans]|uniref:cytochrome b5 n=1 Tax=Metabacillus halosaccharovorans TaxID=930124 RepID=UPI003735ABCB
MKNALLQQQIHQFLTSMQYDIQLLYSIPDMYSRNLILNQLTYKLSSLQFLYNLVMSNSQTVYGAAVPIQNQTNDIPTTGYPLVNMQNGRTFTKEQLANYTGRNGMPAYVAVGDVVYDVTNHRVWAAGTHAGLQAGGVYTNEFSRCHAGEEMILNQLIPVGRLVD